MPSWHEVFMAEGIVCKVWNIYGNTKTKGTSAQLRDSMDYILNDEKTSYNMKFESPVFDDTEGQLNRECKYIENDIKTINGALVGTCNLCSSNVKEAVAEMMETKKFYRKVKDRSALHCMISLPVEESDLVNAPKLMQLCEDVMKELFPDHQAIFAVHTNTDNLHIHCLVNSVGLNGKKIHQPKNFMKNVMHPCVNKYAKKYGFTQNEKWSAGKDDEKKSAFIDNKIYLRQCIDIAIENSNTFNEFINELKIMGLSVHSGKYLSLSSEKMEKPIRSYQLGSNYSIDSIVERIENRLSQFEIPVVDGKSYGKKIDELLSPDIVPLRKYKNMPPEEKKKVISLLKLGRNPWRENQQANWQLNNLANDLNIEYRMSEYKKFYSVDGSISGILEGISSTQEVLAKQKKLIREQLQKNKPVVDIYKRMQKIERRAYLYEHEDKKEFRSEFQEYRTLTKRLERGYGKTVFQVASFIEECENRILYANGQLAELSDEYREVKKYAYKHGYVIKTDYTLVDAIGLYENTEEERSGLLDTDMYYVASKNTDCIVRVEKTPGIDIYGNVVEEYSVVFLSKYGEELRRVDSLNGKKELNRKLLELGNEFDFKNDCKRFSSLYMAKDYSGLNRKGVNVNNDTNYNKNEGRLLRANLAQTAFGSSGSERKSYSFTQALNLNSVKHKEGNHLIMNRENPTFIGSILSNDDYIRFTVLNRKGQIQEIFTFPSLKNRDMNGFSEINKIRNKYGFADDVIAFESRDDAFTYYHEQEKKENHIDSEERNTKERKGAMV